MVRRCPAITRSPRALRVYIDAVGIAEDCKGWLFRTARVHNGSILSDKPMSQPDAWRAVAAGIATQMPDRESVNSIMRQGCRAKSGM
jgi:hypothetical protein